MSADVTGQNLNAAATFGVILSPCKHFYHRNDL
jgi:hypothetical protein